MLNRLSFFYKNHKKFVLPFVTGMLIILLPIVFLMSKNPKAIHADSLIKFDEGGGSVVKDSSGTAVGTITGATWKAEEFCFDENCMYFDGSDWISFGDETTYDFLAATDFTIQFWFRHGPASATEVIIQKYEGTGGDGGYRVQMESDGDISFGVDDANDGFADDNISSTEATYDDNRWHHVSAVKDGTTGTYLYIDGVLVDSDTDIGSTGTLANDDTFYIGDSTGSDSGDEFVGFLDEVKVYVTSARTETEIKSDLEGATPDRGTTAEFGPDTSTLSDGLVGYWKMDDAGADAEGDTITDSSGNGNTGTLYGDNSTGDNGTGMDCTAAGKYGTGCDFDGADDGITVIADSTLDITDSITVSAWVYPNTGYGETAPRILDRNKYLMNINPATGRAYFYIYVDSVVYSVSTPAAITLNTWSLLTATFDMSLTKDNLKMYLNGRLVGNTTQAGPIDSSAAFSLNIGDAGNGLRVLDGNLDEIRIYNRGLSSTEVSNLFQRGPGPVGHWKMDEGSWNGTSGEVIDSSANGLNGTASNAITEDGKFGNSGKFDGDADYITVADSDKLDFSATDSFTLSSWIKIPSPVGQVMEINHETADLTQYSSTITDSGDLSAATAAAMDGTSYGLNLLIDDTTAIYATKSGLLSTTGEARVRFYLDPNSLTMAENNTFTLLYLETSGSGAVGGLLMNYTAATGHRIQAFIQNDGGINYSSYYAITDEPHTIELQVTRATNSSSSDGTVQLWIDEILKTTETATDNYDSFANWDRMYIGAVSGVDAGTSGTFYIDEIIANNDGAYIDPILSVDNEGGSLVKEYNTYATDSGDLTVSASAGLAGTSYGLSATIDDATTISAYKYTRALSTATNKVRLRYYLDPNSLTMANNDEFLMMLGYAGASDQILLTNLGYQTVGGYYVEPGIKDDALTWHYTSAYISDAPHSIELYMQRATNSSSNDGSLTWWIDGAAQTSITGIDNYDIFANYTITRLGAISNVDAGTSGTFYIDELEGNFDGTAASPPRRAVLGKIEVAGSDGGFQIQATPDGDISFGISDSNTLFPKDSVTSTSGRYDDNEWHHITAVKNGATSLQLYIDNVLIGTDASLAATGTLTNNDVLYLGINGDGTSKVWNGNLDDIKIYNYALTPAQMIEDMNADHPAPGSPVGSATSYWKFNEGFATTGNDESSNGNDLTLSANTLWTDSGKFSKGLAGATNQRLSRSDDADFDFDSTDDFTWAIWFKRDTVSNAEYLISKRNGDTGYAVYMDSDGDIVFGIGDGVATFPEESIGGSLAKNYDDNAWHQLAVVKDGTSSIYLYVDGIEIASDTSLAVAGSLANSGSLYIMDDNATDGTDEFLGTIDELQIFRSALSASQIKVLYNQSKSVVWGATSTDGSSVPDNSSDRSYCIPGDTSTCRAPISEWTFDENTGTGTDAVHDTSSNNWDGDMDAGMTNANWVPGKIGSAMQFNGTSDRAALGTYTSLNSVTSLSVSAWVSPNFTQDHGDSLPIFDVGIVQFYFDASQKDFACGLFNTNPQQVITRTTNVTWTANTWHHVACTWDGSTIRIYFDGKLENSASFSGTLSTNISAKHLGFGPSLFNTYWLGKYDTIRVYDYFRTHAQINWEYAQGFPVDGAPVIWYKADECTGSTLNNSAVDSDGKVIAKNATITIGGSLSNTATGDCGSGTATEAWNNGTIGKRNGSLDFDGTDDYAATANTILATFLNADTYANISWGAWVNPATSPTSDTIIHKNNEFRTTTDASGNPQCEIYSGGAWQTAATAATALATSTWSHVMCTYDGANILLYVNGTLADTQVETDNITSSSATALTLARDSAGSGYFDGQIDEVMVYTYALNQTQIRALMNQGTMRFGPDTGSPQ